MNDEPKFVSFPNLVPTRTCVCTTQLYSCSRLVPISEPYAEKSRNSGKQGPNCQGPTTHHIDLVAKTPLKGCQNGGNPQSSPTKTGFAAQVRRSGARTRQAWATRSQRQLCDLDHTIRSKRSTNPDRTIAFNRSGQSTYGSY